SCSLCRYMLTVTPSTHPPTLLSTDLDFGVLLTIGSPGGCRAGQPANGVDPATNEAPAGRVIDQSSSSPVVTPDGGVIYGSYTRYNYARGHMFRFDRNGNFVAAFDFGWDSTPAIYAHNGT